MVITTLQELFKAAVVNGATWTRLKLLNRSFPGGEVGDILRAQGWSIRRERQRLPSGGFAGAQDITFTYLTSPDGKETLGIGSLEYLEAVRHARRRVLAEKWARFWVPG